MIRTYIIILFFTLGTQFVLGQGISNWTTYDTLKIYDDKILVAYHSFSDSVLSGYGQAFHYPDTLTLRKSKWLPRFIKVKVPADSIVLHGIVKKPWTDSKYMIGKYENGKVVEMTYYNSKDIEISRHEFYGNLIIRSHWDPEQGTNMYYINRKKKNTRQSPLFGE